MDFMNRGNRPVQPNQPAQSPNNIAGGPIGHSPKNNNSVKSRFKDSSKLLKIGYVVFLGLITVLIIAVILSVVLSKDSGSKEYSYVDNDRYQAVFLNGGQVYFGKISSLNSEYLSMGNIYYLRVNQQVQPNQQATTNANDISLVKLGCELHGPEDSMVINREQIIFWENLKTDGQVAKAVEAYIKANPDGQKCDEQNTTGGTGANNTGTTTTPTTTTTPAPTTTTPRKTNP